MTPSRSPPRTFWQLCNVGASQEEMEVAQEAVEDEVKVEDAEDEDPETREAVEHLGVAGQTSKDILTIHHHQCARNIIYSENQLIGVKNQLHVPGKTTLFQKTNETVTSLR